MQKRLLTLTSFFIFMSLLLGACNLPGQQLAVPTVGVDTANTAAALTVVALSTKLATNPTQTGAAPAASTEIPKSNSTTVPSVVVNTTQPTATQTSIPIQSAATLTPTKIPPTATKVPPTAIPIPCDRASFVSDISIPDNTMISPGASFTKKWRLQNNGSCTWTTSYALVFEGGAMLGGPVAVNLPTNVTPGQTIDLSVNLQAPSASGSYQGFWKLQNASGTRFGIGTGAQSAFWVKIVVGVTPTPGPSPTNIPVVTGGCQIVSVSPPYNTSYTAGADFDSKWTLKNIGSATWSKNSIDYRYLSGTKMYKHNSAYDLSADVASGSSVDIIVDSIAPSSAGTYTMTWGLAQGGTTLCTMSVTIRVK